MGASSHHVSTNIIQVLPQEGNTHGQVQLYNVSDRQSWESYFIKVIYYILLVTFMKK